MDKRLNDVELYQVDFRNSLDGLIELSQIFLNDMQEIKQNISQIQERLDFLYKLVTGEESKPKKTTSVIYQ